MNVRRIFHRLFLLTALAASTAAAFGQGPPPPVPGLPDSARQTTYTLSGSTCGCAVNFQLYQDSNDIDSWLEVYLGGVRYPSTDPSHGWTITSATGQLNTIPRPIIDAVLTFNAPQTGTVIIVGAQRPRRTSEFQENAGVPARAHNQTYNTIVAMLRENWDKTNDLTGRGLFFAPGNATGPMPKPSACAGAFLSFDGTGLNPVCNSAAPGTGNVVGPSVSTPLYFGTGYPWCDPRSQGAKGDGSTPDDAAFTACLTILTNLSPTIGGVMYVPPGHYCLSAGTFSAALAASNTSIIIRGAGSQGNDATHLAQSWLDVCGADVDGIHFHAKRSGLEYIRVTGAPFTTNPAHSALTSAGAASWTRNVFVEGGYYACFVSQGVTWFDSLTLCNNSYGTAVVEVQGGLNITRAGFDSISPPAYNNGPTNWTANTVVTANQTLFCVPSCTAGAFIIIYQVGGTTGSSLPTLQKYGTTFADGTATAILAAAYGQYGLEVNGLTSAGARADSYGTDYTGIYNWAIHVTGQNSIFTSTKDFSTGLNGQILVDGTNSQLYAIGSSFSACVVSGCDGVKLTSGASSATFVATGISGNVVGIEYDAGTQISVVGGNISGISGVASTGINVGTANLSNISISGVAFGVSGNVLGTGINFTNGTSDYISIFGNSYQYVTTPFSGTISGTHNRNETAGVTCSGSPTSSYASVNGIATHC